MKVSPLNMQLQSSRMSGPATPLTATLDSPIGVPGNVVMPPSFSAYGWTPTEWSRWGTDKGRSIHMSKKKSVLLGMENFGNTCYANSVLQALYHCRPFRDVLMEPEEDSTERLNPASVPSSGSMKYALTNLFHSMALTAARLAANPRNGHIKKFYVPSEGRTAAVISESVNRKALEAFLGSLRKCSDLFDSTMHHDAHEFLNFLLNQVDEDVSKKQAEKRDGTTVDPACEPNKSFVNRLFQGVLTNETRCLSCETITNRDEEFLDLSINVAPYTSVSSCLRIFSDSEMLAGRNKFFCDSCSSLQEAEKRMKIKSSPQILALHLKRFRYDENLNAYIKHACRVVFPLDLRLFNSSDESSNPDRLYELVAIVIHVGSGVHQGHYVSIVKIGSRWALFDDEDVQFISESEISQYYGDAPEVGSAYVLFYQTVSKDRPERDRQEMATPGTPQSDVPLSAKSPNFRAPPSSLRRASASYGVFASSPLSPARTAFQSPAAKGSLGTSVGSPLQKSMSPLTIHEVTASTLDADPKAEPVPSSQPEKPEQVAPSVSAAPVANMPVAETSAPEAASQPTATPGTQSIVSPTKTDSHEKDVSQAPQSTEGRGAAPVVIPVASAATRKDPEVSTPALASNEQPVVDPAGAMSSIPLPEAPMALPSYLQASGPINKERQASNEAPPLPVAGDLEVITVGVQRPKETQQPPKEVQQPVEEVQQPPVQVQQPPKETLDLHESSLPRSISALNMSAATLPWLQNASVSSTSSTGSLQERPAPKVTLYEPGMDAKGLSPPLQEKGGPPATSTQPIAKPAFSEQAPPTPNESAPPTSNGRRRPLSMLAALPIRLGSSNSSSTQSSAATEFPASMQTSPPPLNQLNLPTPPMTPLHTTHPHYVQPGARAATHGNGPVPSDEAAPHEPISQRRHSIIRSSMAFSPSMSSIREMPAPTSSSTGVVAGAAPTSVPNSATTSTGPKAPSPDTLQASTSTSSKDATVSKRTSWFGRSKVGRFLS
ncbi:ubiquitinyl hydrolase 1 [Malassezia nana]|uniref:Ubiquitin carboxyl-terminal hydrolase n=1 Tax=Malassezia nana TaxID=180528 RepID=A0AAF0EM38_9BASI|nr:ubiquitinyl hydrolase 1 [Malassezia nana]